MGNSFVFFEPVISTIGEQASPLLGLSKATLFSPPLPSLPLPSPPASFFVEAGPCYIGQVVYNLPHSSG